MDREGARQGAVHQGMPCGRGGGGGILEDSESGGEAEMGEKAL